MNTHATLSLAPLALLGVLSGPAAAKTFKVGPGDSIQAALDAASAGDKVVVTGVHREHVSVNTSGVTLIGKDATVDGQYIAYGIAVWVPDVTVKGFRVIHGAPGIRVFADRVTVADCVMRACTESSLNATGDDLVLTGNAVEKGAGVHVSSATSAGDTRFEKNTLRDCDASSLTGGRFSVKANDVVGADGLSVTADHEALVTSIRKNAFDRAGPLSVTATGSATVSIEKNTLERSREVAIQVETADAASVELRENMIVRCAYDGVDVEHASSGTVTSHGNRVVRGHDDGFVFTVSGNGALTSTGDEVDGCEDDGIDANLAQDSTGSIEIVGADVREAKDSGLELDNHAGSSLFVAACKIRRCQDNGVDADGIGISLLDLDVRQCDDDGIDATGDFFTIRGCTVIACGQQGIQLYPDLLGGSTIAENVVRDCGLDGLWIDADSSELVDNKSIDNGGDGIQVDGGSGNVVDGNLCEGNGHEGIDNRGSSTLLRHNVMSGNGGVLGPDLAGAGDGTGTVSGASTGNQFGTGGLAELQRLDL